MHKKCSYGEEVPWWIVDCGDCTYRPFYIDTAICRMRALFKEISEEDAEEVQDAEEM